MAGRIIIFVLMASVLCLLYTSKASPPRKLVLVSSPAIVLYYHNGPLLTQRPLRLHLLWYGTFTPAQQAIVTDFILSLGMRTATGVPAPTVASWWKTTSKYKDAANKAVSPRIMLGKVSQDLSYSMGKNLTKAHLSTLVQRSLTDAVFPETAHGSNVYVVLTADDVTVEDFCMSLCGLHTSVTASNTTSGNALLPFIWVGNPGKQCPGFCAWPYAVPQYGPPNPPLVSPNGDVGMEGIVINLATLLAGAATNPFGSGYYEGNSAEPMEAVTACAGIFASGSYPGYPGNLLSVPTNNARYNAVGVNNRMFLLPAMWKPSTRTCHTVI